MAYNQITNPRVLQFLPREQEVVPTPVVPPTSPYNTFQSGVSPEGSTISGYAGATPTPIAPIASVAPVTPIAQVPAVTTQPTKLINPPGALFDRNTGLPLTQQTAQTAPAVPGSAAAAGAPTPTGMFTQAPEDVASQTEYNRMLAEQRASANQVVDPNQIYQEMLRQRQAQIDAINNVYADRLTQARIQGQGRIESRQFAQGRAGQIGSGTGEAGINAVQQSNVEQQQAIQNEQALAIQEVYGKIDAAAKEEAKAKTAARTQSAEKYMETLRQQPEKRKKLLASSIAELVARGVDVNEMTPEEIDSYIEGLKSTPEEFEAEFNKQRTAENERLQKLDAEARKASLAEAKDMATITKTLQDIENWGKATEYQKAQLKQQGIKNARDYEIAKEKLGTGDEALTGPALSQKIYKTMADPSWNTPKEGQTKKELKLAQKQYIMLLGGNPADYGY